MPTQSSNNSFLVDFYVYDSTQSKGSFSQCCANAKVGSFIMNLQTGVLYLKFWKTGSSPTIENNIASIAEGDVVYYPLTGLQDYDIIDANSQYAYNTNAGIQLSDDRKKNYQGDVALTLAKILKIPVKYFTYKDDTEGHLQIGTSAQELQKICPELIVTNKDGFLMVDYSKLSLLALRAVKLQNAKVAKLEKTIKTLEERLAAIEKRLEDK